MNTKFNHDSALELLREYNKEPFHILHGLTVGVCMNGLPGSWAMEMIRISGKSAGSFTTLILKCIRKNTARKQ